MPIRPVELKCGPSRSVPGAGPLHFRPVPRRVRRFRHYGLLDCLLDLFKAAGCSLELCFKPRSVNCAFRRRVLPILVGLAAGIQAPDDGIRPHTDLRHLPGNGIPTLRLNVIAPDLLRTVHAPHRAIEGHRKAR